MVRPPVCYVGERLVPEETSPFFPAREEHWNVLLVFLAEPLDHLAPRASTRPAHEVHAALGATAGAIGIHLRMHWASVVRRRAADRSVSLPPAQAGALPSPGMKRVFTPVG